ncbi:hypothetical protein Tco_1069172 [Tanacetum coccineum]|uniref:Uncharacterized protein n=1 Tax=Tanacetum coccineum TaxID=301880 RepID=A0ABQ5HHR6_9ASTR
MIKEFVQANIINGVKNQLPKFLPKEVSDFSILVIQSMAAESLSEYELKRILFENIDKSRSYHTHDKYQALYDALLNSFILDDDIARGQADAEKVLRKRDHGEKDPLAGPNQEEPVNEPVF